MYARKMRPGFTLVELLVVIAILAILAALLLPVLAQVRQDGYKAVCMSNAKQIALACRMYAMDSDEVNVPERLWLPGVGKKISFRALLQPYVKNKQVFVCPSTPDLNTFATFDWQKLGFDDGSALGVPYSRLTSGYAMNRVHWQTTPTSTVHPSTGDNYGVPDASIVNPAECILIADSISGFGPTWDGWYSVFYAPTTPGYIRGVSTPDFQLPQNKQDMGASRHNGGATYIFDDGHAKWLRPEQIPCRADECWWAIEHHH